MACQRRSVFLCLFFLICFVSEGLGEEVGSNRSPRYEVGAGLGVALFSYEEKSAGVDSDFDSMGPTLNISGKANLPKGLGIRGSYTGAPNSEDTETFRTSSLRTQKNDTKAD